MTGRASAGSVAAPRPRTGGPTCVRVHSVVADDGEEEEQEEAPPPPREISIGRHSRSSPPAGHRTLTSLSATRDPGLPESPSRHVSSCDRAPFASEEVEGASMAPKRETSIEGGGVAAIILSLFFSQMCRG